MRTTDRLFVLSALAILFVCAFAAGGNAEGRGTSRGGERGTFVTRWDGIWDTTFGEMALAQDGTKIRGMYGSVNGWIDGDIGGSTLTFHWSEPPDRTSPYSSGEGEFILGAGGTSFSGTYRLTSSTDEYEWTGVRLRDREIAGNRAEVAYCLWRGTWETSGGAVIFSQDMNSSLVTGEFVGSDGYGTIEGAADGWSVRFTSSGPSGLGSGSLEMMSDLAGFSGRSMPVETGEETSWSGAFVGSELHADFDGEWDTNFGTIDFTEDSQTGAIFGRIDDYSLDGSAGQCEVTGRVVGNACAFTWRIENGQSGRGVVKLGEKLERFRGSWIISGEPAIERSWSGDRETGNTKMSS
jgi:hypothetical protein